MTHYIRTETTASYGPVLHEQPLNHDLIDEALAHLYEHLTARRVDDTAFSRPDIVKDYLKLHFSDTPHEVFSVMFLDSKHRLLAIRDLFRGTLDASSVHPREVVKEALKHNAGAVLLAHNHPSGDPDPSEADRRITTRLQEALDLIGVRVLDHIVVGETTVSLAEKGYM